MVMQEDAWHEVSALGVGRGEMRRLLFLPLVYVAAASRRRDIALLDRLIESSAQKAQIDAEGAALAHGWLRSMPTPAQFDSGLSLLRSACQANEWSISVQDLIEAMLWACSAAQFDREKIGLRYTSVSNSARHAVGELESALAVEVGDLWSDVMEDLGEQLPRSKNVFPPQVEILPEFQHAHER
jgi:hypothetical protein